MAPDYSRLGGGPSALCVSGVVLVVGALSPMTIVESVVGRYLCFTELVGLVVLSPRRLPAGPVHDLYA